MRISVVIPEPLDKEVERYKRQHGTTTSRVVREALQRYLVDERRRAAGDALKSVAASDPIDPERARQALDQLRQDREHSNRL
jgi:metal-responsive CopG/Arc/MetJ family transcriptional regulator